MTTMIMSAAAVTIMATSITMNTMSIAPADTIIMSITTTAAPVVMITTATITILSYGAMAGAIGGGGLGAMALLRGHGRQERLVLYVSVLLLVVLVQVIQTIGTKLAVKTDRRIHHTENN